MSSFICEKCGKEIIDTPQPVGYITGCPHYPLPSKKRAPRLRDAGFTRRKRFNPRSKENTDQ